MSTSTLSKYAEARFSGVGYGEESQRAFLDCIAEMARERVGSIYQRAIIEPGISPEAVHYALDQGTTILVDALRDTIAANAAGAPGDFLKLAEATIIAAAERHIAELVSRSFDGGRA